MTITEQGHDVDSIADKGMDAVVDALANCALDISEDDYELVHARLLEALKEVDGARCVL
jgi:hemoglobin-like flavoprotein